MALRHDCPDCPYETDVPDKLLDHLLGQHNYLVRANGREVTWHFVHKALEALDRATDEILQSGGLFTDPFLADVKESLYRALPPGHPGRRAYG